MKKIYLIRIPNYKMINSLISIHSLKFEIFPEYFFRNNIQIFPSPRSRTK